MSTAQVERFLAIARNDSSGTVRGTEMRAFEKIWKVGEENAEGVVGTGLFFGCSGINDDGEEFRRHFNEILRSVKGFGIEEKRVSWTQLVDFVAMPVTDPALKHIDEFHAGMLEHREHFGFFSESNEIRLDGDALADGVAEKVILVPGPGSAALDLQPLSRSDERSVSLFLELPEKGCNRDLKSS